MKTEKPVPAKPVKPGPPPEGKSLRSGKLLTHSSPSAKPSKKKRRKQKTTGTLRVKTYGLRKTVKRKRTFPCDQCAEKFKTQADLTQHVIGAHVEFTCTQCPATFQSKGGRDKHVKSHSASLKCDQCPCMFVYLSDLKHHQPVHSDEKPQQCPSTTCKKRFKTASELHAHCKKHAGEEWPCAVPDCDHVAVSKKNLASHMDKHNGVKCRAPDCDAVFDHREKLRTHYKKSGH